MNIQTVYFNFDDCVVTWYHPSKVDWQRIPDPSLRSVYDGIAVPIRPGLSPVVKAAPVWIIQIRHKALKRARWVLVAGTDPDYSQTVFFLRKELGVSIV